MRLRRRYLPARTRECCTWQANRKGERNDDQIRCRGDRSFARRLDRDVADARPLRPRLPGLGSGLGRPDLRGLLDGPTASGHLRSRFDPLRLRARRRVAPPRHHAPAVRCSPGQPQAPGSPPENASGSENNLEQVLLPLVTAMLKDMQERERERDGARKETLDDVRQTRSAEDEGSIKN